MKKCLKAKLRFVAGLPMCKCFGKCQFNPIKDRASCYMSCFQDKYEFGCHRFYRTSLCDVTGNASV